MLSNFNKQRFKFNYPGQFGLPESYPIPNDEDQLFYIQRNLNTNTIVYTLNRNADGSLQSERPMDIYWRRYQNKGVKRPLNHIQNKLVFGYKSWLINADTFKFNIVSYPQQDFYLAKDDQDAYQVVTKLNNEMIRIYNIYAYAENFGAFPQMKYIEFFGLRTDNQFPAYIKALV